MPQDLNKPVNDYLKFLDRYDRTTVVVILCIICMFFAIDSFFRSGSAESTSNRAEAKVDFNLQAMQRTLEEERRSNELLYAHVVMLRGKMSEFEIELPPLPER